MVPNNLRACVLFSLAVSSRTNVRTIRGTVKQAQNVEPQQDQVVLASSYPSTFNPGYRYVGFYQSKFN